MPTTEIIITVDRPVKEVFAYAVDIERLPEWNDVIQDSWPSSDNQAAVGATYVVKANVMGRTMEIPLEVVAYEPNRLYAYKSGGSMPYVSAKMFDELEARTCVTERIVIDREGRFSKLLNPILLRITKRSHQKNLEQLKAVLESVKDAGPV